MASIAAAIRSLKWSILRLLAMSAASPKVAVVTEQGPMRFPTTHLECYIVMYPHYEL